MHITNPAKPSLVGAALLFVVTLGGCVSRSDYDLVVVQNKQLQQQLATQSAEVASKQQQINRLQGAIKYTVNSDLLFPSGGWQMSEAGKRIISGFAQKLAPTQDNKLWVYGYTDNQPIGPGLRKEGISSNEELSQKRAQNVMEYLISQGVKPDLLAAKGFGESNPVASNATAAGRAKNRRVELTLNPG